MRDPLYFWPPEKKGLPVACVLAEKGEPSGMDSHKACCCPPGGRSVRPDVRRKGTVGDCDGSSRSPGFKASRGEALAGQDPG